MKHVSETEFLKLVSSGALISTDETCYLVLHKKKSANN